jgi:hypothetical protein
MEQRVAKVIRQSRLFRGKKQLERSSPSKRNFSLNFIPKCPYLNAIRDTHPFLRVDRYSGREITKLCAAHQLGIV